VQSPGSWWDDWQKWVSGLNGKEMVPARVPGKGGKLKALEDAPGSFVALRLGVKESATPEIKATPQ
jgi:polyhydroxyalkanoate synthase